MTTKNATVGGSESHPRLALEDLLEVSYEPIIDLSTRRPVAVRALLVDRDAEAADPTPRAWLHPTSRTRLHGSLDVDMHVLSVACQQLRRWNASGFGVQLCVPLDAATLEHPDLVAAVEHQARTHGVDPGRIELGLTPVTCVADGPMALKNGQSLLDQLGTTLAVLGFGTGHSSLAYLTTLPVVCAEVDATLGSPTDAGAGAGAEAEAGTVPTSVLALFKSLGIRSSVAAVQSGEEARRWQAFGCEMARGPNFSLPMSTDETAHFLERHVRRTTCS